MENTVIEGQATETGAVENQERTFTQAELDEIVKARLGKERAKFADYDDIKAKALKLDEMEEANKSELQKATEKADALQAQLDALTKANGLRDIRDKVANETGVPVSLLTAETEDDCKAQAEAILAFATSTNKPVNYPSVKDAGETNKVPTQSTAEQFKDWLNDQLNN